MITIVTPNGGYYELDDITIVCGAGVGSQSSPTIEGTLTYVGYPLGAVAWPRHIAVLSVTTMTPAEGLAELINVATRGAIADERDIERAKKKGSK